MMQIYQENILDHFKNPRNYGKLAGADASYKEVNTLCGDEIEIQIKINGDAIKDIKFNGTGCAISLAAASMLTEEIKWKKISDVERLHKEDILEMLGIPISAPRLKCALLALYAIKNSLVKVKNVED